jgi:hypothetical protein
MLLNNRGQNIEYVLKSVEDNKKYELILKHHIKSKYDIEIIKNNNPYKYYDFSYNKIHKIEYKGLYYSLNEEQNTATKNNIKINSVIISKSKIAYFKIRKMKNTELKFYLVYGFYDVDYNINKVKSIIYRYIDISNILDDIILTYKQMTHEKARHYKIPITELKKLPTENPFNISLDY